jgi:hypothetical protein
VGIAATGNGQGYVIAAKDGGIFNFGNASFDGNTYTDGITGLSGPHPLNAPIVGMAEAPDGGGYWLVGADGGVFNFGSAQFYGSTYTYGITGLSGPHPLDAPIVGMAATPGGHGYWLVGADGGVFDFGSAPYQGSLGGQSIPNPIVAVAEAPEPLAVTTEAVPSAAAGLPYHAALQLSPGSGGDVLSATGLPAGLSLEGTTIEGTPTSTGPSRITLTLTDSLGLTATSNLWMDVVNPIDWSASSTSQQGSDNWSGWVLEGGPFSGVSGTFVATSLQAAQPPGCGADGSCALSEWVGVGGAVGNGDILQAGVEETPGSRVGTTDVVAWWEQYPNPQVNIPGLPVAAGNSLTVNVFEETPGAWALQLVDDSTGASFATTVDYDGTVASAEWILETPELATGLALLPSFVGPVDFAGLGTTLGPSGSQSSEQAFCLESAGNASEVGQLTSDSFALNEAASCP